MTFQKRLADIQERIRRIESTIGARNDATFEIYEGMEFMTLEEDMDTQFDDTIDESMDLDDTVHDEPNKTKHGYKLA